MLVYFLNHSSAMDHLGGAERSMIQLVEDWTRADPDFEPFFLTKAPAGQFVAVLDKRGWKHAAFRFGGWAVAGRRRTAADEAYFAREDYAATTAMIELMQRRRPDLVVTNTLVSPWAAFAAKTLGIPHAWFVREYGDLDHGFRFTQGRAATLDDIGRLSERVFANSFAVRKHLAAHIPDDKLTVIYPQVDLDRVVERSRELPAIVPFPADDPGLRITVVGRLTPSKGQWRAIDAAGELHRRGVRVSLCFVGAKVEADADLSLMRRARLLGIDDRVVLAGERSNPFPYVAAADVAVMPSDYEAFGRTTLEYLALGKPVLATRTGGSAELIESGVNGFLFDGAHPGNLADDLALYARDPDLIRRHGEAALASTARYTVDEHGNGAAIAALVETANTADPYRLPGISSYWFSLPALVSANPGSALTVTYVISRLWRRAGSFSRNPIAAIRRRLRS